MHAQDKCTTCCRLPEPPRFNCDGSERASLRGKGGGEEGSEWWDRVGNKAGGVRLEDWGVALARADRWRTAAHSQPQNLQHVVSGTPAEICFFLGSLLLRVPSSSNVSDELRFVRHCLMRTTARRASNLEILNPLTEKLFAPRFCGVTTLTSISHPVLHLLVKEYPPNLCKQHI